MQQRVVHSFDALTSNRTNSHMCTHSSTCLNALKPTVFFFNQYGPQSLAVQTHPQPNVSDTTADLTPDYEVQGRAMQWRKRFISQWNSRSHPETRLHIWPTCRTNISYCSKMFALKVVFIQGENLYAEMTLVLQILYCLGSPAHGPPTGFLKQTHEKKKKWD